MTAAPLIAWAAYAGRAHKLSLAERAVLAMLCLRCRCGEEPACHPTLTILADDVGVDVRSVQRALRGLEGAGLIRVERSTGRSVASTYHVIRDDTPAYFEKTSERAALSTKRVTKMLEKGDKSGVTKMLEKGDKNVPPTIESTIESKTPPFVSPPPGGTPRARIREGQKTFVADLFPIRTPDPEPVVTVGKRKAQVAVNWRPNVAGMDYAEARNLDPAEECASFLDYHRGRGNVMLDWQAAWRTWCRNAVRFAQRSHRPEPVSGYEERRAALGGGTFFGPNGLRENPWPDDDEDEDDIPPLTVERLAARGG